MNIDLGSFAFGSSLKDGVGTPSWGTALGQRRPEYYITREGSEQLLMGMIYCSVPLNSVSLPLGRGGRVCNCVEAGTIQLASVFFKVYVNGVCVNTPFIMVLQKEDSESHSGRRGIKYTDKATYEDSTGTLFSNIDFIRRVYEIFKMTVDACWFVYDITVKNYDELHMSAVIVNKDEKEVYENSHARSEIWTELIESTRKDELHLKNSIVEYPIANFITKYDNEHFDLEELQERCDSFYNAGDISKILALHLFGILYAPHIGTNSAKISPDRNKEKITLNTEISKGKSIGEFLRKFIVKNGSQLKNIQDFENMKPCDNVLINALKTKPFLILAGISGTGKSRIVRELARSCWKVDDEEFKAQKPRNFEMIQVKPNWHDSSELLGYVSRIDGEKFIYGGFLKFVARAWEEPNIPYFLCLDEMNLAPVEQYFAEYLSVLESRKVDLSGNIVSDPILPLNSADWYRVLTGELTQDDDVRNRFLKEGIPLPPNLIVVGTVNMDETTYAFSRKVLDRAMTIEMNEVDLYGGLTEDDYHTTPLDNPQVLIPTAVEGKDVYTQEKDLCDRILEKLKIVNDTLENTPFKIAYRTRNEFLIYAVTAVSMGMGELQAFDEMVCMKILPRIEGDQKKVGNVLNDLRNVLKNIFEIPNSLGGSDETEGDGESTEVVSSSQFESKSLKKLDLMQKRLNDQYYCSFWN